MIYPEARYKQMVAMSDEEYTRARSETTPPVQVAAESGPKNPLDLDVTSSRKVASGSTAGGFPRCSGWQPLLAS